jgi:hypothetical protein
MKTYSTLIFLILTASLMFGQDIKRISLTPHSNVPSASIVHGIQKKCTGLVLTLDVSKADYLLEAVANDPRTSRHNFELTLFTTSGDVLYQTGTLFMDNAIRDVCNSLKLAK